MNSVKKQCDLAQWKGSSTKKLHNRTTKMTMTMLHNQSIMRALTMRNLQYFSGNIDAVTFLVKDPEENL